MSIFICLYMYIYISLFTYLYTSYIKTCIHIYIYICTASPETLIIFGGVLPAQVENGSELVKACSVPESLRRLRTKPWGS